MLEIDNLTAGYDSGFAVHDIDMRVKPGEIVGIIGPNGAGKTTLLRALTRVITPRTGRILLEGQDVRRLPIKALARKVAVVSQSASTGDMDVWGFVLLGRLPHYRGFQFIETQADRDIAEWALRMTGAWRFRDRVMNELSGGERQLVLIARALAQKPLLLMLDEPIAHLDIGHQVDILDLLRRLNRDMGLTIVMVLHDLNLASEYCHALALLHEGRLHTSGRPDEVIKYRTIEKVYKTVVVVDRNPMTSKPYVLPVPETQRAGNAPKASVREGD